MLHFPTLSSLTATFLSPTHTASLVPHFLQVFYPRFLVQQQLPEIAFIPDHSTSESALSPLLILPLQLIFLLFSRFWHLLAHDCTIFSVDAVLHFTAWIIGCLPYRSWLLLWHSLPCKSKFPSLALVMFLIPKAIEEHVKKETWF